MFYTNFIQKLFNSQKASVECFIKAFWYIKRYFTGEKNEEKSFKILNLFFSKVKKFEYKNIFQKC